MSNATTTIEIVKNFAHVRSSADSEIKISVSVDDGDEYDASCDRIQAEIEEAIGPEWVFSWVGEGNTDADGSSTEDATLTRVYGYTYSIYDANPASASSCVWPSHSEKEIFAEDDETAIEKLREILEIEACGLSVADGYEIGDTLYATLDSDETGIQIATVTYVLTESDLA